MTTETIFVRKPCTLRTSAGHGGNPLNPRDARGQRHARR